MVLHVLPFPVFFFLFALCVFENGIHRRFLPSIDTAAPPSLTFIVPLVPASKMSDTYRWTPGTISIFSPLSFFELRVHSLFLFSFFFLPSNDTLGPLRAVFFFPLFCRQKRYLPLDAGPHFSFSCALFWNLGSRSASAGCTS